MTAALAVACAQTLAAQTFLDLPPASVGPAPPAALRREDDALRGLRARWRPSVELGAAVLGDVGRATADGVVDWPSALTLSLGVDARRAVSDLLEIHGRLEFVGPQRVAVVPRALSEAVAPLACAGTRAFSPLSGFGAHAGVSVGLRARVFSLRSPFYVGLALRAAVWLGGASGEAVATCVASDGSGRVLDRASGSVTSSFVELGGALETGFRFGAREQFGLSLRLIAGGVGVGDPAVRGAVLSFGWSLR